jgi:predicted ThiF/HesA family dinucleotide-utilizing enzyme
VEASSKAAMATNNNSLMVVEGEGEDTIINKAAMAEGNNRAATVTNSTMGVATYLKEETMVVVEDTADKMI